MPKRPSFGHYLECRRERLVNAVKKILVRKRWVCASIAALSILAVGWIAGGKHWYWCYSAENAINRRAANDAISELASANQDHPRTHYLLARAYRRLGQMQEAGNHLQVAQKLGCPPALLEREQWLILAQLGRLSESEEQLRKLMLGDDPNPGEICEALVSGYLLQYRFDDASIVIDAWKADYPDDPLPHFSLGLMWVHVQTWQKAADEFKIVLEVDPNHPRARIEMARSLAESQKFDEAIIHFKLCLKVAEIEHEAKLGLARCYLPIGDREAARGILKELLAVDSESQSARTMMGELCLMEGMHAEALGWLEPALARAPTDPMLRHQIAVALHAAGRHAEADEHDAFVDKANAAIENARVLMDQLRRDSNQAESRHQIGSTLVSYGSPAQGRLWLLSALEVNPYYVPALQTLIEYYDSTGQSELADQHRQVLGRLQEAAPSEKL